MDDATIRHLEMIQAVIARQAGNCLALKALTGTITAAILAYTGATAAPAPWMPAAGILPVLVFWLLDARYLRQERQFRSLYDAVRRGRVDEPFSMDAAGHGGAVAGTARTALSWSVMWFYLVNLIVVAGAAGMGWG